MSTPPEKGKQPASDNSSDNSEEVDAEMRQAAETLMAIYMSGLRQAEKPESQGGERRHYCRLCSKSYPSGQALGGHQRLHYNGNLKQQKKNNRKNVVIDLNELPPDWKMEGLVTEQQPQENEVEEEEKEKEEEKEEEEEEKEKEKEISDKF